MDLPSVSKLYKKMRNSIACQLLTSHDPITHKIQTQREESQKIAKFQPML
jgi:hypothetical protein